MANELALTASLRYTNSAAPLYKIIKSLSIQVDAVGKKYHAGSQSVGTGEENLVKGDIGTIGYMIGRNLDASAFRLGLYWLQHL